MKKINLKKLKELSDSTTEEPWNFNSFNDVYHETFYYGVVCEEVEKSKDAKFIVEARNNWNTMIEALEEAYKLLDQNSLEDYYADRAACKWLKRFEDAEGK